MAIVVVVVVHPVLAGARSRRDDTRFGGHGTRDPEVPPPAKLACKNTWVGRSDPLKLSAQSALSTESLTLHRWVQRPSTPHCLQYLLNTRALLNHVTSSRVVVNLSIHYPETLSFVMLSALSAHNSRSNASCWNLIN
jgi:hypothetical protein